MSCVRQWLAMTIPCVRCLKTMYQIRDLKGSNKRLLKQTMLRREENAQLMERAEKIYELYVFREKHYSLGVFKKRCP